MKVITLLSLFCLNTTVFAGSDFKDKLLNAAKDKKNQEQAKEIAQKGIDYIKYQKKEENTPVVEPSPPPAPDKKLTQNKKNKSNKKKKKN